MQPRLVRDGAGGQMGVQASLEQPEGLLMLDRGVPCSISSLPRDGMWAPPKSLCRNPNPSVTVLGGGALGR